MIVPAPRQKVQAVTDRYKHLQAADTTNPFTTWESDVPLFLRGEASFLPRGILRCQHLKFSLSLSLAVFPLVTTLTQGQIQTVSQLL